MLDFVVRNEIENPTCLNNWAVFEPYYCMTPITWGLDLQPIHE